MSRSAMSGPLILVVDDDHITRRMVRHTLERAGYRVTEAENGRCGVAQFLAQRPALVLLDVIMPGVDGFRACIEMRARSEFSSTPILMLTSLEDGESVNRAFEAGATDFIIKPINLALLSQRVRYALRARAVARELRRSQMRLESALRIARLSYWEYSLDLDRLTWSESGDDALAALGQSDGLSLAAFLERVHREDREVVRQGIQRTLDDGTPYAAEHRLILPDGDERRLIGRGELQHGAGMSSVVGSFQDVTDLRRLEQNLKHMATHDSMTELPNRENFLARLQEAIDCSSDDELVAVLVLHLDDLKLLNETLGSRTGAELLRAVAERLASIPPVDTELARVGDCELAVPLAGLSNPEDAARIARQLLDALAAPFRLRDRELLTGASIGISLHPADHRRPEELLKHATVAVSRARDAGKGSYRYYTADMTSHALEHLALENDLRRALERDEFELAFQPQLDARTGALAGLEALLRWSSPRVGPVSPAVFVPILEEMGLIGRVGEHVLRLACRHARDWSRMDLGEVRVAVNVSGHQLGTDSEFLDAIKHALREYDRPPSSLELEITESVIMEDTAHSFALLARIRESGVRVAVDDFGTGYSSLAYLTRLPADVLKIDRSFVAAMDRDRASAMVVTSTIDLAHNLGLEVVAEGIEDRHTMENLARMGCDIVQGYHVARPMSPAQCQDWLRARLGRDSETSPLP